MSQPYRLLVEEPGLANVYDRATGDRLGHVVQWRFGRQAYLPDGQQVNGRFRYRADAVALVWKLAHPGPKEQEA